jgi:ribosomal protein L12E/L44/L45/RPP1/RPP2
MSFYKGRYAVAFAFMILAVAVYLVVTNQGQVSQDNIVKMCEAINGTVTESNARISSQEADTKGLVDFLEGAKKARVAAYERAGAKEDLDAANTYTEIIAYVKANVKFNKLTPLDCIEIVE